jgi:hypothetical protein
MTKLMYQRNGISHYLRVLLKVGFAVLLLRYVSCARLYLLGMSQGNWSIEFY